MTETSAEEYEDSAIHRAIGVGNVKDVEEFVFAIVSTGRPGNVSSMQEKFATYTNAHVVWIVGKEDEVAEYRRGGAGEVLHGGGLCASRNLGLKYAQRRGKMCVQLSDDVSGVKFMYYAKEWRGNGRLGSYTRPACLSDSNALAKKANVRKVSFVAAAQLMCSQLGGARAKLAGVYPNANPGTSYMMPQVSKEHFCVGDFLVVDPSSTILFDETMTLKEDYDFTCAHLHEYGAVCRVNRILIEAEHYVNKGGAVDTRNARTEKKNIAILRKKWPGVMLNSPRGPTEVRLYWDKRDVTLGGYRNVLTDSPVPEAQARRPTRRTRPKVAKWNLGTRNRALNSALGRELLDLQSTSGLTPASAHRRGQDRPRRRASERTMDFHELPRQKRSRDDNAAGEPTFKRGQEVSARWRGGGWYGATVEAVLPGGRFRVRYNQDEDDAAPPVLEDVAESRVRAVPAA